MASILIDFGRQVPLFGIAGTTMHDGITRNRQINIGRVGILFMPFSLPAMLGVWEEQIRNKYETVDRGEK